MDDAVSRAFRDLVGEDHWRWIQQVPPKELVELIRGDRIDVLVDLAGHSANNRLDAILHRSAPVQVHWLGFAASTGAANMDYRISDEITEPTGQSERWSSEEIWRLPRGFHAISMPEGLPDPVLPPCLENGYLTFGSFNNINKLGVRTLALWARLLRAVPDARLILKHQTMEVFDSREAVRSAFALHGVDPKRIAFKGVTRLRDEHFQFYGLMDVALDPLGYNGTTTTCEALYMGVPVLTLPGRTHASRVSASLLHQVGLDGWIARDEEHYFRIARAAAANPQALALRRANLRKDFLSSSLSDGIGLARALEEAYRSMWRRACGAAQPLQNVNPQEI
jgi:predicted O-linked N-acetylglucosamine transferase (SPINDLY family)